MDHTQILFITPRSLVSLRVLLGGHRAAEAISTCIPILPLKGGSWVTERS